MHIEDRDGIALVRIDRPPANAMDLELLEEGRAVLDELERVDPRAVVLTGRDGFFSAGVDLRVAPTLDSEGQRAMVDGINRIFAAWYGFPRPVVCAVNGHAIAGGMILALCGDYRVGVDAGAKLGLTELKVGVGFPAVALAVVKAELAPPAARVLVLRAHLVDPAEAQRLGVLDELTPAADLEARALELAGELAALPPGAYATVKRQARGTALEWMEARLRHGDDPMLERWIGTEAPDAARAILAD